MKKIAVLGIGKVGDLAAFETWPELWIEDESRLAQAQEIVQTVMSDQQQHDWFCRGCQEKNDAAFQVCWNCGREVE